ncbi:MAG: hypothetical protein Q8P69_00810 [bacterium]|nr:hypothetical protein [bacterium]
MKTLLKTISENAFFTADSKTLNIIGIFETINTQNFPAIHPKISCVLSVAGEPNKIIEYYPILKGPTGKMIIDGSSKPLSVTIGGNGKFNLIFNLANIKLENSGIYSIELHAGDLKEELNFIVQGPNA